MSNCQGCGTRLDYEVDGRTFSREVIVEETGVYDGGLYFECPLCGYRRHRWPEGSRLRDVARPYVEGSGR